MRLIAGANEAIKRAYGEETLHPQVPIKVRRPHDQSSRDRVQIYENDQNAEGTKVRMYKLGIRLPLALQLDYAGWRGWGMKAHC